MRRLVAQGQAGIATRVVGPIETVVADRLAVQGWRAHQDRRQVVGILWPGKLVAPALKDLLRIRADREGLQVSGVRHPLLVETRRVDGLLDVHLVIDDVENGQQGRGNDATAARRADHHHGLAILGHDGRAHRRQRRLARCDGVGFTLDQAVHVRHADLDGEIVHFIVEDHPGLARHHAGTEPVIEGVGHRDRVAPLVW